MTKAPHLNELIASRRALLGGLAGLPLLNLAGNDQVMKLGQNLFK
ncbi:MAG TPA: hypothetical protein PLN53_05550 [Terricaulis sp.]|nr:hypothetical protein [Terricaulis sp.]